MVWYGKGAGGKVSVAGSLFALCYLGSRGALDRGRLTLRWGVSSDGWKTGRLFWTICL